jgi:DNA N-6-adenine-methyltransferase (Dam)
MTIGSHQTPIGKSQVHLTPRWILDPIGPRGFDPCANKIRPWDCAALNYTIEDDGLAQVWPDDLSFWLNPPFHRYQIAAWLRRAAEHNRGIALFHARTDTDWFRIVKESAASLFFLDRRVIFLDEFGHLRTITDPDSKHFGKPANSGAPVALAGYGDEDTEILAALPAFSDEKDTLAGLFVPLIISRSVLVTALRDASWCEVVAEFLRRHDAPIAVADLYRAFRDHPKTKSNPHWREKLRQTLQRGAGRSVARDQWVAA